MSAGPHRLILMLFDGALKAIAIAKTNIEAGNIALKGASISKAISIVDDGLRSSLDKTAGGELAMQLDQIYEYVTHLMLQANLTNRVELLEEAANLLSDLRESWEEMGRAQQQAAPSTAPAPDSRPSASYGKV